MRFLHFMRDATNARVVKEIISCFLVQRTTLDTKLYKYPTQRAINHWREHVMHQIKGLQS